MTEAINTPASKAVKASVAAAAATPLVTESVETLLENPVAVATTIKWGVIGVSVVAGAGLGAGVLYGIQKFKARKQDKKIQAEVEEISTVK